MIGNTDNTGRVSNFSVKIDNTVSESSIVKFNELGETMIKLSIIDMNDKNGIPLVKRFEELRNKQFKIDVEFDRFNNNGDIVYVKTFHNCAVSNISYCEYNKLCEDNTLATFDVILEVEKVYYASKNDIYRTVVIFDKDEIEREVHNISFLGDYEMKFSLEYEEKLPIDFTFDKFFGEEKARQIPFSFVLRQYTDNGIMVKSAVFYSAIVTEICDIRENNEIEYVISARYKDGDKDFFAK